MSNRLDDLEGKPRKLEKKDPIVVNRAGNKTPSSKTSTLKGRGNLQRLPSQRTQLSDAAKKKKEELVIK